MEKQAFSNGCPFEFGLGRSGIDESYGATCVRGELLFETIILSSSCNNHSITVEPDQRSCDHCSLSRSHWVPSGVRLGFVHLHLQRNYKPTWHWWHGIENAPMLAAPISVPTKKKMCGWKGFTFRSLSIKWAKWEVNYSSVSGQLCC